MKTWVLIGLLAATAGVAVSMFRMSVDTYRDIRRHDDDSAAALREMNKARLGGVLVVLPALLLMLAPFPRWVAVAYLIAAVLVLGLVVLRRHRGPR